MKKEMPVVDVLMSIYKENEIMLMKSITSVLEQTYKNIHLIIVLDNPKNYEAQKLLDSIKKKDRRVCVIYNMKNLGLPDSLNAGILRSIGKYIARMDADDIALPDRIEKQVKYMETHDVDILGMAIQKIDETDHFVGKTIINPQRHCFIKRVLRYKSCIAHPTWMVRTEVMQKLEGYRNINACEDYDFLLRALDNGYKLGNLREVGVLYRRGTQSISDRNREMQLLNSVLLRDRKKYTTEQIYKYQYSEEAKKLLKDFHQYFLFLEQYKTQRNISMTAAIMVLVKAVLFTRRGKEIIRNHFLLEFISCLEFFLQLFKRKADTSS